jgi:drug/metabolite transporter (DMT)-like permease
LEPFILYALTASLFFTFFTFIAKYIISNKIKNFISFIYMQGIFIVLIFPLLSYTIAPDKIYLPPLEVIPYAIISGGTSVLAYLLMYYGLTRYDASMAGPIVGIKPIFVIPLSYIFLGEFYGIGVILWILVAMFGAIMTSLSENIQGRKLFTVENKGLWIFLASAFLYAVGNVAVKPAMELVTNYNFLIWREFAWFGVLLALMPFIFHREEFETLRQAWKGSIFAVLMIVLFQYFAYIFMFQALGFSVQLTEGIMASSGVFAVTIGFTLSRIKPELILEKQSNKIYFVRMIGALLIMFGIYQLSYFFNDIGGVGFLGLGIIVSTFFGTISNLATSLSIFGLFFLVISIGSFSILMITFFLIRDIDSPKNKRVRKIPKKKRTDSRYFSPQMRRENTRHYGQAYPVCPICNRMINYSPIYQRWYCEFCNALF